MFEHLDSALFDQDAAANELIKEWVLEIGGWPSGYPELPSERGIDMGQYHHVLLNPPRHEPIEFGTTTRSEIVRVLGEPSLVIGDGDYLLFVSSKLKYLAPIVGENASYSKPEYHYTESGLYFFLLANFDERGVYQGVNVFGRPLFGERVCKDDFCIYGSEWRGNRVVFYASEAENAEALRFSQNKLSCGLNIFGKQLPGYHTYEWPTVIKVDSAPFLVLDAHGFGRIDIPPGAHTIENLRYGDEASDTLEVHCDSNELIFVQEGSDWSSHKLSHRSNKKGIKQIVDRKLRLVAPYAPC